jgi:predicted SnoaL-like aldol condensation-catalyzing enzyme
MSETTERNKQRVREVIDQVVNTGDAELAAEYYREDYIQHNPHVAQGLAGLQALIRAMHASGDPMRAEILMMIAEGDMVWALLEWSGGPTIEGAQRLERAVEIFRIEDGMMAEHWDVIQLSPPGG